MEEILNHSRVGIVFRKIMHKIYFSVALTERWGRKDWSERYGVRDNNSYSTASVFYHLKKQQKTTTAINSGCK